MDGDYAYDLDEEPYEYEIFKRMIDDDLEDTEDLSYVVKEVQNGRENGENK